jgi:energy-converting hydrogenase B subunit D
VSGLQAVVLAAVALTGTAVALCASPLRQLFLLGIYGLSLALMFFALQAPDVALSEIVVSTVGLPVILLAALRRIAAQDRAREEEGEE